MRGAAAPPSHSLAGRSTGPPKSNPAPSGAGGTACAVPVFLPGRSCDYWNFNASNPCVYVGGNYNQNGNHGLFYVNYNSVSNANGNIGSRHL